MIHMSIIITKTGQCLLRSYSIQRILQVANVSQMILTIFPLGSRLPYLIHNNTDAQADLVTSRSHKVSRTSTTWNTKKIFFPVTSECIIFNYQYILTIVAKKKDPLYSVTVAIINAPFGSMWREYVCVSVCVACNLRIHSFIKLLSNLHKVKLYNINGII